MRRFVNDVLLALVVAVVVGLGSALVALELSRSRGALAIGPWTARLGGVGQQNDPYSAAVAATTTDLPLGAAEGIVFTASRDNQGLSLTGSCDYLVVGQTPAAQLWSLTVYDADARLIPNPAERWGFHSRELLREPDGSFLITLSAAVQPGNWLPIDRTEGLIIVLRLYDTPLTTGLAAFGQSMPAIIAGECA